jgi:hypothetical protein
MIPYILEKNATMEDVPAKYTFSTAKVRALAEERGIDNPFAFARLTGLSYPTARKWFLDEGMGTLDATSIKVLCDFFKVDPGELFDITEV